MSTLDTQEKLHTILCNLAVVKTSLPGLFDRHQTGHALTEFEFTGLDRLITESMELINTLD